MWTTISGQDHLRCPDACVDFNFNFLIIKLNVYAILVSFPLGFSIPNKKVSNKAEQSDRPWGTMWFCPFPPLPPAELQCACKVSGFPRCLEKQGRPHSPRQSVKGGSPCFPRWSGEPQSASTPPILSNATRLQNLLGSAMQCGCDHCLELSTPHPKLHRSFWLLLFMLFPNISFSHSSMKQRFLLSYLYTYLCPGELLHSFLKIYLSSFSVLSTTPGYKRHSSSCPQELTP